MSDAPIYISGSDAKQLLDRPSVLRVVAKALKDLSDGRLVNGTKGVHAILRDEAFRAPPHGSRDTSASNP